MEKVAESISKGLDAYLPILKAGAVVTMILTVLVFVAAAGIIIFQIIKHHRRDGW